METRLSCALSAFRLHGARHSHLSLSRPSLGQQRDPPLSFLPAAPYGPQTLDLGVIGGPILSLRQWAGRLPKLLPRRRRSLAGTVTGKTSFLCFFVCFCEEDDFNHVLLQPSDLPEDCAIEKSGFFKFKEALRRVAISTEGRKSRAASGAPSFPGVGGVSEVIYYGHGKGEGVWCWAGRRGCGWTIVDRTWDYTSVTHLLVPGTTHL